MHEKSARLQNEIDWINRLVHNKAHGNINELIRINPSYINKTQKLIKHSKWKKVDTRLKEIWDIAREGLGKKDEKENEKFEPFNTYMIVNVWEDKDNNS